MVVDRACGQIGKLCAGRRNLRLSRCERKGDDRIGVGDIQGVRHPRYAVRRVQVVDQNSLHLRNAVAIGVTQQSDAIAALVGRTGSRLNFS